MNLTLRLSLPILIGLLFTMGYLHFYWEPHQLAKGKAVFEHQNQSLLDSSESAIIRDILEGNFAALIANIEYLLRKHEGVWFNMEIFSDDGKRLYPLFDTIQVTDSEEYELIHQERPLRLAASTIGKIVVDINWFEEKQRIKQDVKTVRNMLLGMVMFALFVILFTQLRLIVRPLVRLRDATREIAEGNLEVILPEETQGEVGELTRSFGLMAQELAFKQRALDQHANVCITDPHGCIIYVNDNFIQISGYNKKELLGQNLRILNSSTHPPEFYKNLWKTISAGDIWKDEICNRKKDGNLYWVGMTIVPQIGKNNQPERFISIGTDITKRKKVEAELLESKLHAETANLAKSRFLANMSHEFRTPLNNVIGMTQMLAQRQELTPAIREEVDTIHTSGQMLLSLVNDILDLSKIEAGEINLEMVPLQLESILYEFDTMLVSLTNKKGLELLINSLPATVEGYVISDPTRLRQMLLNLLNNAIKFTSNGYVSLWVEVISPAHMSENGRQYERLRFLVKDTGCGIPADILPTLFDAFRQADSSITRRHGGTGLGLSIVKQLCEEMGGDVYAESVVGKGSLFALELPFRIATDEEVKEAGLYKKKLRILLAEDDSEHRENLIAMCHKLGWNAEAVEDGRRLLQRYEEMQQAGDQLDCLIVDWQMPVMDGLEALYELREKYGAEGMPGLLMVTGYETEQLRQSAHAEIPDFILDKPISVSSLVNGMGQVFTKHFNDIDLVLRSSTLDFAHLAWLSEVKILVVDDAQVNLDLATKLFTREGAIISTCMNGAEALEWLQTPGNHTDIILMDIQMPVMDGNTAVQKIRRIESLKKLPVIALTATALVSERKISLKAGMDDYQTKPFDTEMMIRLIRRYVGQAKGVPVPVREKHIKRVESHDWPVIDGIEPKEVRERLNDDLDLFLDLLNRFTDENRDLLQPMVLPAKQSARDALLARMHKLAGSAGLIGAIVLSGLARQVENSLRANDHRAIPALLDQLRDFFCQLDEAISPVLRQNKEVHNEYEPVVLASVELDELREALQQKKISAVKMYQKLKPALRSLMDREAFKGLDEAMVKIDLAGAQKWLEQLSAGPAPDESTEQDNKV